MYKIIKSLKTKLVIEKSKFFCQIFNCYSQQNQTQILKEVKRQNLSATHICYASVIYQNGQLLSYSSDDREPAGTAGLQILQALKEQDMVNTLCVVVRYFGGIKLGVAGLGRAYKESALSSIEKNKIEVTLKTKCKLQCSYNDFNKIKTYLTQNNIEIFQAEYNNNVSFVCYLSKTEQVYLKQHSILTSLNEEDYC